jgi:sulfatase maturation enzyme AslB (radical SAM superfamily)
MECVYCYTPKLQNIKKEHQTLDLSFAKRGIDDFFRDNSSRHIRFYGIGEPTLEFELMKQIHSYAKSKAGKSLTVELQSNGFFSEEVAKWIYDNVNILWLSCDGIPEIHNKQRPTKNGGNTSDVVECHLKCFVKNDKMQAGVRVTLTADMINNQREIVKYFSSIGVKYINVLPTFAPVDGSTSKQFVWNPEEFAKGFLDAHNEAKKIGIWYNTMCIVNFDEPTRHACRSCTPNPHLTTDGFVTCCDFAQLGSQYTNSPLQQLIYGCYDSKSGLIVYNEDAVYKIRSRCVENLSKGVCVDCKYIYNCAGGCLGQVVNETGDLLGRCETNCKIVRFLAEHMTLNDKLHPALHS